VIQKANGKVEKAIKQLLECFQSGKLPAAIARTVIQKRSGGGKPSDRWSLGNNILMLIHGTNDARGYRQWEDVGRRVKKGAKAFYILGPCTKKKVVKVTDENGEEKEEEKVIITGFKAIPVFRYEDTEGKEIPMVDYAPKDLPPLINVARKFGIEIQYAPFSEKFFGCYNPGAKLITLCTHDVKTFFHELAHAVHGTFKTLKTGQDRDQEIIAETVAAVLCQLYDVDGYIPHSYSYIAGYAQSKSADETVKAIMKVLADVERILNIILAAAEEEQEAA